MARRLVAVALAVAVVVLVVGWRAQAQDVAPDVTVSIMEVGGIAPPRPQACITARIDPEPAALLICDNDSNDQLQEWGRIGFSTAGRSAQVELTNPPDGYELVEITNNGMVALGQTQVVITVSVRPIGSTPAQTQEERIATLEAEVATLSAQVAALSAPSRADFGGPQPAGTVHLVCASGSPLYGIGNVELQTGYLKINQGEITGAVLTSIDAYCTIE